MHRPQIDRALGQELMLCNILAGKDAVAASTHQVEHDKLGAIREE